MNTEVLDVRDKIKERRKAKGLTIAALSTMSRVSPSHIGRIERGERIPSAVTLRNLAEPLGYHPIELLKLAGILPGDVIDLRMVELKEELKREAVRCLGMLLHKIDSF